MLQRGLPGRQVPALTTHTPDSVSPVSSSPTDLHTGTTKKYHPATTVHQQEPAPLSPHFHLVASTRQIRNTSFTPEYPLLFTRHTSTQPIKWLQKLSNGSSSRNCPRSPKQVQETPAGFYYRNWILDV